MSICCRVFPSRIFRLWRMSGNKPNSPAVRHMHEPRKKNRSFKRGNSSQTSDHGEHDGVASQGPPKRMGGKHPPGLKGKEIGLWYARKNKKSKNPKFEVKQIMQMVAINDMNSEEIENVLLKIDDHKHMSQNVEVKEEYDMLTEMPTVNKLSLSTFQREYLNHHYETRQIETKESDEASCASHLIEDKKLNIELWKLQRQKQSRRYIEMQEYRKKLPAYGKMEEIVKTVDENQVVVITGETGCGKTTQVPQFILDSFILSEKGSLCHILCTQPRRISAISVAERIADERDERCGARTVGYQIRLENKLPPRRGSILFCTTGMVLQYLQGDPYLKQVSHLILDEVHERDIQTDFLITILKNVILHRRDLKLILMSATLNADKFSRYFGGCPMLNIPGFTFPVKEYYLEDVLEVTRFPVQERKSRLTKKRKRASRKGGLVDQKESYADMKEAFLRTLHGSYSTQTIHSLENMDEEEISLDLMKELIKYICFSQPDGAILVFLPGWDQISKLSSLLRDDHFYAARPHIIIPLHSMMPTMNQKEVFERPPRGVRKIILATNIAETSITINDVIYVVDCGKIKLTNFNAEENLATLNPEWVSRANAHQRRGRAGRVQPGICYHMFTKLRENLLESYSLPEIQRTRLEELCLQVKILKLGKFWQFISKALDPPSETAVNSAVCLLQKLNALDSEEMLTPLGYHLARLPLDPQTGKMILFGAIFGCLDPILTVAANLNFKDAFVVPLGKEQQVDEVRQMLSNGQRSDHLMLINAYCGWERARRNHSESMYCRRNFLSVNTLKLLEKMRVQLAEHLYHTKLINSPNPKCSTANVNSGNVNLIRSVICAGLYPNVAKLSINEGVDYSLRKKPPPLRTKEDGRVGFHLKSVNAKQNCFTSPWLVYYQKIKSTQIFLHDTTMVLPLPLIFFGGRVAFVRDGDLDLITVDDYMKFHCTERTANLILKLRKELERVLDDKIKDPKCVDWNPQTQEGAIMCAIIDLITSEENLTAQPNTVQDEVLYQPLV